MKEKLTAEFIKKLSKKKNEPEWMLQFRLKSFETYLKLDNPAFGPLLDIDFDDLLYYKSTEEKVKDNWQDVNENTQV